MKMAIFWGIPVLSLVINTLLLLSLLFAKKSRKVYVFIGYVICVMLWIASSLCMKLEALPGALFWNKVCVTFTFLTPVFIYAYLSVFTKTTNLKKTFILILGVFICLVINWSGLLVNSCYAQRDSNNNIIGWFYEFDKTYAYIVFAYYFLMIATTIIKGIGLIIRKKIAYSQINGFIVGMSIMFIGYALNMIPVIGKYPVDIAATLLTSILLFISLYRKKMFEFKIIVSQGTALFVILVFTLGTLAFGLRYFFDYLDIYYANIKNYILVATSLLIALLIHPFIVFIKKFLYQYMNQYATKQSISLNQFQTNISNNLDIEIISDELLSTINESLHTSQSCLMLYDKDQEKIKVYKTSSVLERIDIAFNYDNPLVKLFMKYDNYILNIHEINSIPELKSLWESEKRELKNNNVELIVPLKSHKKIIGLLLIMAKENKRRYNSFDYDNLKLLAIMTGVAIDNAHMFQQAQKDAYTDSQTNLFNHKYFVYSLAKMLNQEKSKYRQVALLMIDLDNFKLYNELYGFKAGDDAIIQVAQILNETLKEKGSIYRYSGQEFAVVLTNCESQDAINIAEDIRRNIEQGFVQYKPQVKMAGIITASIGLCCYPVNASDDTELLKNGLFALYVAKNSGKNQVINYVRALKENQMSDDIFNSDGSIMMKNRATIYALTAAIDTKDHYTFAHSQNVAYYTVAIAQALNLDNNTVMLFEEAALLHDIGKIGIPETILSKTGRLTDDEYSVMKTHVELCVTTIKFLPSTNHVIPIIFSHHERFDGRGYPRGLSGHEIPLGGRILAIADAFDAMVSKRAYKQAMSLEYAIGELEKNMNKQFDGEIVKLFVSLINDQKIIVRLEKTVEEI